MALYNLSNEMNMEFATASLHNSTILFSYMLYFFLVQNFSLCRRTQKAGTQIYLCMAGETEPIIQQFRSQQFSPLLYRSILVLNASPYALASPLARSAMADDAHGRGNGTDQPAVPVAAADFTAYSHGLGTVPKIIPALGSVEVSHDGLSDKSRERLK